MMRDSVAPRVTIRSVAVLALLLTAGCRQFSITEQDESAGFNGGFEIVRSGLPVNWSFHYPPITQGDVDISLDTTDYIEGRQSLKLVVHRVQGTGGWQNPGLFQVPSAEPQHTYRVSMWLKNEGCTVVVFIRSENPTEAPKPQVTRLDEGGTRRGIWYHFDQTYTVPKRYHNIRIQVTVAQPGTLWIDDVRVEDTASS